MKIPRRTFNVVRKRITYANVVASLALFLALGGVSYAAVHLPRNSVSTPQLKYHAVSGSKIKPGAVLGSRIRDGSVKHQDVNLPDLASHLPNVASATTYAAQVGPIVKRVNVSASGGDVASGRAAASAVAIAKYGQITVYAKCFDDTSGPTTHGEIYASTASNGAILAADEDELSGDPFLDTNTAEDARQIETTSAGAASSNASSGYNSSGWVLGPDGKGLRFNAAVAVNHGATDGLGPYSASDACVFEFDGVQISG